MHVESFSHRSGLSCPVHEPQWVPGSQAEKAFIDWEVDNWYDVNCPKCLAHWKEQVEACTHEWSYREGGYMHVWTVVAIDDSSVVNVTASGPYDCTENGDSSRWLECNHCETCRAVTGEVVFTS